MLLFHTLLARCTPFGQIIYITSSGITPSLPSPPAAITHSNYHSRHQHPTPTSPQAGNNNISPIAAPINFHKKCIIYCPAEWLSPPPPWQVEPTIPQQTQRESFDAISQGRFQAWHSEKQAPSVFYSLCSDPAERRHSRRRLTYLVNTYPRV